MTLFYVNLFHQLSVRHFSLVSLWWSVITDIRHFQLCVVFLLLRILHENNCNCKLSLHNQYLFILIMITQKVMHRVYSQLVISTVNIVCTVIFKLNLNFLIIMYNYILSFYNKHHLLIFFKYGFFSCFRIYHAAILQD